MSKLIFRTFIGVFLLSMILAALACHKPETDSSTANANEASSQASPRASPLTGFQKDLQDIRNGQYTYVYLFSRKDQKVLDADDGAFLRKNAPQVVDWIGTDEGKKVFAGTNF